MINNYEKAFNFFNTNRKLTVICLVVVTLLTILKQFMVTMFIAYFLIIFFLAGILGIIKNEEKFKRKSFKRILIFSLGFYDKILSNLVEFTGIYLFNVCLAGGLTVFPLKVWNIFKSDAIAFYSLIFLCLIVFVYRLPIFVFSFIDSVIIPKESGKYAIIKIKEITRKNNKVWIELSSQFFVYILLTFLLIKSKHIVSVFFLDELRGIVFLFFMVRNFYWYNELIKESGEYKKVYDPDTYSGFYNSIIGRFIM